METQTENKTMDIPGNDLAAHIVQAVTGFFKSISLKNENALQDTLRLLTLWFKYGAHDEVGHAMATGFTSVEVDTWLEVIPQVRLGQLFCCFRAGSDPGAIRS
jgi:FKBP12-rapamycin complex-associated protein